MRSAGVIFLPALVGKKALQRFLMQTSLPKAAAQAKETARLKQENARLRARLAVLEKEVEHHRNLRKLADRHSFDSTGKTAEDYVCRLLGVKSTERHADHDFVIGRRRFEITCAELKKRYLRRPV